MMSTLDRFYDRVPLVSLVLSAAVLLLAGYWLAAFFFGFDLSGEGPRWTRWAGDALRIGLVVYVASILATLVGVAEALAAPLGRCGCS